MNALRIFLYLFIPLLINSVAFSQEANWELRKNEEGIKVFTRQITNSKIIEFKAETTIDAPVSSLVSVLRDVESYNKWMTDLKAAKKLKTLTDNTWVTYYIASVPWPLSDRDVIFQVEQKKYNEGIKITLKSNPDFAAHRPEYVRINKAQGEWIFIPESEKRTKVFYQFYADPEINVPTWITNLFIVDGPFQTLKNLKLIAIQEKYR